MSRTHRWSRFGPASSLSGGGLLLAITLILLAGCAAPREYPAAERTASESSSCRSYKVGEARNVLRSNTRAATRRLGGHFWRGRPSAPGETNVLDIEVFRYEDPMCARGGIR